MTKKILNEKLDPLKSEIKDKMWKDPQYYKKNLMKDVYNVHNEYYRDKINTNINSYSTLKSNVKNFVKAKNYTFTNELLDAKTDIGNLDSDLSVWSDTFDSIWDRHNGAWLDSETDIIEKQSDMVETWEGYSELEGDTYITYLTAEDDLVREDHQALDGATYLSTDDFWDDHTPPIDYNCRCTTYVNEVATQPVEKDYTDIEPMEGYENAYRTGKLFSEDHPYFSNNEYKKYKL